MKMLLIKGLFFLSLNLFAVDPHNDLETLDNEICSKYTEEMDQRLTVIRSDLMHAKIDGWNNTLFNPCEWKESPQIPSSWKEAYSFFLKSGFSLHTLPHYIARIENIILSSGSVYFYNKSYSEFAFLLYLLENEAIDEHITVLMKEIAYLEIHPYILFPYLLELVLQRRKGRIEI